MHKRCIMQLENIKKRKDNMTHHIITNNNVHAFNKKLPYQRAFLDLLRRFRDYTLTYLFVAFICNTLLIPEIGLSTTQYLLAFSTVIVFCIISYNNSLQRYKREMFQ